MLVGHPGGKEKARERTLTDKELTAFLRDPVACTRFERLASVVTLLLLTGQRRGEITAARWPHFDFDSAIWTIPAELSKNGKEHKVPLSPVAIQILTELRGVTGERPHVLASQHSIKKPDQSYYERVLSHVVRENEENFGIARLCAAKLGTLIA